jgi:2-methylisocitrate lyase-like PEP mutase family enzyme
MNPRHSLRELLRRKEMCIAPGAYDALSAKMICNAGFPAIYVTGFGVTASLLGKPDIGFITLDEMAGQLRRMIRVATVPVIADAEAGFGNALNAMRTVQEYEAAGVAGLHMEDQYVPKRYRPDGLPQVVSAEEHVEKIRAAVEARSDPDFCIIGRTDALGRHGLAEAVRRANLYVEAGADMIFVHGAKEAADLRVIVREIRAPNVVNYSTLREGHVSPLPSISELEQIGFRLLILPGELLLSAAKAMSGVLSEIRERGELDVREGRCLDAEKFLSELEAQRYRSLEERFLPQGADK